MPRRARRAPQTLVALAAALLLAGCGGDSARDDVQAYIRDANAIQSDGSADLAAANSAYRRFSRGKPLGPVAVAALQDTAERLRRTRERLARLRVPVPARGARRRLLAVFDANVGLAEEAALLTTYIPAARRLMGRLPRFGAALRRGLTETSPDAQSRALRSYARRLAGLESRMRELAPPPVLLDSHRSQLLRLDTARALSGRLRAAIARRDGPAAASLLLRFRRVYGAGGLGIAVQRRAVRAYRERLLAINEATAALRREQARLERSLGS